MSKTTSTVDTKTEAVHLSFRPRSARLLLLGIPVFLAGLSVAGQLIRRIFSDSAWWASAASLVNVASEQTLPTLVSAVGLVYIGLLALLAAARDHRLGLPRWHGRAAACVAFFLAADEFLVLHERTIMPLRRTGLGDIGVLHYTWVVPALILVVIVLLVARRWLITMPPMARRMLLLACAVYVSGAVGMEMIAGAAVSAGHDGWRLILVLTTIEELMEMLGIGLAIEALLHHLATPGTRVEVRTP